jgi:predicted kinase
MEAIIFCGIQGSGKSTFYKEHFFNTHVRISLDLLKTRHRENMFLQTCFALLQPFVVDNTNATKRERHKYIEKAKAYKFKLKGYYFQTSIAEALERNKGRIGKENIPVAGIITTHKKLEPPTYEEGFDKLYEIAIINGEFIIKDIE